MKRNNSCRKRRRTKKKKKTLYLPHELIIEILLKLPVKSLISFKCVCKSWFSLISDPHFANSYFQLKAATHSRRILFRTSTSEIRCIDLEVSIHDDSAFMLPQPYLDLNSKVSCRGFIVFYCPSNIYLWNPTTGANKQIALPPNHELFNLYGFGYDPSTDDYLVVSVSKDLVEIFSLRANVWKEIVVTTHLPYYCKVSCSHYPNVDLLLNGAIHWLAFRHDTTCFVIVSFHLTERKLLEIPLPTDVYYVSQHFNLWVFRGFLSLWILWNDTVDIWVMKEYKVGSSWIKTLVLHLDAIPNIYPICCTKSGDIVATNGGIGLVKYNDKGEFLEHNSYCKDTCGLYMTMYTESLLSLPNDSEQA